MVSFENAQYSVPAHLLGAEVFARVQSNGPDAQVVIVHVSAGGPVEVARHHLTRPGSPAILDPHFPDHRQKVPSGHKPCPGPKWRPSSGASVPGRGPGCSRPPCWPRSPGPTKSKALGVAAIHHRFAHGDLASLLDAAGNRTGLHTAAEDKSLTQGTAGWAGLGITGAAEGAR